MRTTLRVCAMDAVVQIDNMDDVQAIHTRMYIRTRNEANKL